MARSNPKLLIHGSCVSRDAFGDQYLQASRCELVGYHARSSLATVFSRGMIDDVDFDAIASPFQRRMVRSDIEHGLAEMLEAGEYDLLLIDLIDERFSLFVDAHGARCTISGELLSSGFDPNSRRGTIIKPFTDEFFDLWEDGWRKLVAALDARGHLGKVVVNAVFWSQACSDGTSFMPAYSRDDIERANAFLRRQYARMRADLNEEQFLKVDPSLLVGAVDHRWGKSPFHYVDAYYNNLLENLERYSTQAWSGDRRVSDQRENGVGFVKYFRDRFRLAGRKFRHEEIEQNTVWYAERVTLQKGRPGLDVGVRGNGAARIKLNAIVNGELIGNRNLLLIVDGEELDEAEMQAMGYLKSKVGYFRYLKNDIQGDQLKTEIAVNAKVTSFKVLTWNFDEPVLLFDVNLESKDVKLVSSMLMEKNQHEGRPVNITREPTLRANLLLKKHRCGPECVVHCDKWFESMDAYATRHAVEKYGREPVFIEAPSGELLPASMQKASPAFLTLPDTVEEYLRSIGDKSRNMIQKASRLGYHFLDGSHKDFDQDIYEIRTSDPMRQGRPIPDYYYSNPPVFVLRPSSVGCEYHTERFFGILHEGRLVSYISLFMYGEFAQINHILCHKEHVKNGVMNLNVFYVVKELIEKFPWVKSINYLYVRDDGLGIDLFKRSVGFKPQRFIAYDSTLDALQLIQKDPDAERDVVPQAEPRESQKPRMKLTQWRFVRESVQRASLASKLESLLQRSWTALPRPSDSEFAKFCSTGLGEATESHPVGACFLVPFPSRAEEGRHPDVARYLARRFKGNPVPEDGFSVAFRGGKLRALAYFGIEEESGSLFDGVLVLEKVA